MSQLLDRLNFLSRKEHRFSFSDGHGVTTDESREWEESYRKRWQHDKVVRSTHGANCTGSCSWKIYVKGGIVTWETQQTDYPTDPAGPAQTMSLAEAVRPRSQLQLVHVLRQPGQVSQ